MRTPRRLAILTLAATAGLSLAACSSTVHATGSAAPTTESAGGESTDPATEEAGDTQTVPSGSSTDDEELPEPGAGVPGDDGLCQAVVGWFGYVSLSLLAADDNGEVDPADVVPLLEALRDAPQGHQDASADLLDSAEAVSSASDEVIDELQSGTDLYTAVGGLEQPVTDFANACTAAGVTI
ncbi:hypothetical protein [Petropleomorpha daqingensis]|uniref:Lipoprotein n=1 Tax=Petropleomorpha daqingensis TaxID=2026353 RepID=A0A853CAE4_9ACTN|nr:hypothetical protein [Petropleomorpha daqingensis]NYJ04297.1 hypothetical protein [Petropleomorpha daqingensis]